MTDPLDFHVDWAILVNRVLHADKVVTWCADMYKLWLKTHDHKIYMDMGEEMYYVATSYKNTAQADFRTIRNGEAKADAFEAWFLADTFVNDVDKDIVAAMLQDHTYIKEREWKNSNDVLLFLKQYNYLSKHVGIIMNDPVFTDVRDRSTANFAWFVKFERSLKESKSEII